MASKSKKRKLAAETYIVLKQPYLDKLARHIPSDYHSILFRLGMEDDEIFRIEQDNKSSVRRTAFKGLLEWQRQFKDKSEKYMIHCLKKALSSVGRNDLCQKLDIREKYKNRYFENNIQTDEEQHETQFRDIYNSSDGEVNEEQIDDKQVHVKKKSIENLRREARKIKSRNDPGNKQKQQKQPAETKENEEEVDDDEYDSDKSNDNDDDDEEDVDEDHDDHDDDNDDDHDDDNDDDHDDHDDDNDDDHDDYDDANDDDDNDEYFTVDKSIVAGVESTDRRSSILDMIPSKFLVKSSVLLKVVSKSPLISYRQKKVIKYRLDLILTDGVTFIKGVAFEHHAHAINDKISDGYVNKISKYRVKQSNTVPAHKELSLYDKSNIVSQNINRINDPPVKYFTIKEVKQLKPIKQLVYFNPVIVCAVSDMEKPKIKHLRKVLLKDYTEKVVLNMWYEEDKRHVKFEHKRGDSVQATFVEVGEFGEEIYLTHVGTTKMIKQEDKQMKELLKNENRDVFIDKPMSIREIMQLPYSQETATIRGVEVMTFKKERESEFVYRSCSIVPSHGKLIPKAKRQYCKKCCEFLTGEKKVELNAEIKDKFDNRTWIKIFDQCAKAILGSSYETFLKCSEKERVSILKKIERNNNLFFEFKVGVKKDKCNYIIAKKVEII